MDDFTDNSGDDTASISETDVTASTDPEFSEQAEESALSDAPSVEMDVDDASTGPDDETVAPVEPGDAANDQQETVTESPTSETADVGEAKELGATTVDADDEPGDSPDDSNLSDWEDRTEGLPSDVDPDQFLAGVDGEDDEPQDDDQVFSLLPEDLPSEPSDLVLGRRPLDTFRRRAIGGAHVRRQLVALGIVAAALAGAAVAQMNGLVQIPHLMDLPFALPF